ncbi:DUF4304 domain-containing protein [Pseudoxanthomonas sacheonensis]|uniref:DUF4304 domain-containing protein n=1 Tax=Pseudoxanthomonas sacheonensis TaxID=443615 RepID=UPI0013D3484D|nr:DUF4304 domain-containing protein [Pseudoxanthomonas sacheonensis]
MEHKAFLSRLTKRIYPILRADGFKGSGSTLRRINGPVIHVFNIQSVSSENCYYLNMAAHLAFLLDEGGFEVVAEKIDAPACIFRGRIEPPTGSATGWGYGTNESEVDETIGFIVSEWESVGRSFFQRYAEYPSSFVKLIADTRPEDINARNALHLARIALELGDSARAFEMASAGLSGCPERAITLKTDLNTILQRILD